MEFIGALETCLGKEAVKNMLPLQPGDVPDTYADVNDLVQDLDYRPSTPIQQGIANFVSWYKEFYKVG
jgi:UDP-glucuronate 4-epimerase